MRPANLTIKTVALAALALFAAAASAITPAPPEAAMEPIGAASAASPAKQLTISAVQAVPMGKQGATAADQAKKAAVGTIAELEELQRQTALAEARKRLQELSQGMPEQKASQASHATPSAVDGAMASSLPTKPAKAKPIKKKQALEPAQTAPSSAEVVQLDPILNQPPRAKLVNLLVMGSRARADVLESGRMMTIKEGDQLGKWTVAAITTEGVTMEYRYTVDVPVTPTVPPMAQGTRPSIAEAFPAAYALANSQRGSETQDRVKTMKLESATPQEIAAASGGAPVIGGPLPPTIPQAMPTPVMAGGNGMADSTSIPPVPPLPSALGGSGAMPINR